MKFPQMRQTRFARSRGMTLMEVMIVVAIIGVTASMSVYGFGRGKHRSACNATIRSLELLMMEARQQAQASGRPVFLRTARIPALGNALDGQPKLFIRWERIGCEEGSSDGWTGCPEPACLGSDLDSKCELNDSGELAEGAPSVCCEKHGDWIEVADTFRVLGASGQGGIHQIDTEGESLLDGLCWNGSDGLVKVAAPNIPVEGEKCNFTGRDNMFRLSISSVCVDRDEVSETDGSIISQIDKVFQIELLTGTVKSYIPKGAI